MMQFSLILFRCKYKFESDAARYMRLVVVCRCKDTALLYISRGASKKANGGVVGRALVVR